MKENTYVNDGNKDYYAVPKNSGNDKDITIQEAYEKMADALKDASSIGAEKAASVKNNGDGTFEIKQGTVDVATSFYHSIFM